MRMNSKTVGIILLLISFLGLCLVADYYILSYLNHGRLELSDYYINSTEKEPDKAKKMLLLEQGTLLNPTEQNRISTGTFALVLGDNQLASHYLEEVRSPEGLLALGNAYFATAKYLEAVRAYKNSLRDSKTTATYIGLIKADLALGDIDQASATTNNALLFRPDDPSLLGYNVLLTGGSSDLITDPSLRVIQAETKNSNRVNLVYSALNSLSFPQAATKYLEIEGAKQSLDRNGYIELGNSYFGSGEYAKARDSYLQGLRLDPYYPQVYKHLSEVEQKLGNTTEANIYIESYKRIVW